MKKKSLILLLIATMGLSWNLVTRASDFDQEVYVESIITILNIHADAIENLTLREMRYSDNLVRHAVAIKRAFGLLGPMDWHANEAAELRKKKSSSDKFDSKTFDRLARKSQKAIKNLVRAAHEHMERHDQEGLFEALNEMKESCNACHTYLPKSVAPDVWGNLKRK